MADRVRDGMARVGIAHVHQNSKCLAVIIFGQAHIPEFTGTIIIGLVNVASTFLAMKFIDKLGRKWLLLVGYVACNTGVAVQ